MEREKDVAGVTGVAGVVGVNGSPRYDAPDPEPFEPESEVTPLRVSHMPPGDGTVAECGGVDETVRLRSTVGCSGSGGAGLLCMSASQRCTVYELPPGMRASRGRSSHSWTSVTRRREVVIR